MNEFLVALLSRVQGLCIFAVCVGTLTSVVMLLFQLDQLGYGDARPTGMKEALTTFRRRLAFYVLPFLIVALVPDTGDLWKARIGLLKLRLASPENVLKGTDEITRIAKKLECKYLGCDEEAK